MLLLLLACATEPGIPDGSTPGAIATVDQDADGFADRVDNCPTRSNADQADLDADLVGDACDNCPEDKNVDQGDLDADGVGDACPCDACTPEQWCQAQPSGGEACVDSCEEDAQCGASLCCAVGTRCAEDGTCPLPDLSIDAAYLASTLRIEEHEFAADDCAIVEGCVNAPGKRRLLRFSTRTPNLGAGDLFLGRPREETGTFVYSDCHQHYHFEGYANYTVVDKAHATVVTGHKQAFCLMDYERIEDEAGRGKYTCNQQGISTGWADTYEHYLDCQWVDITDLAPGDYSLEVQVNPLRFFPEADFSNNEVTVPITVPAR